MIRYGYVLAMAVMLAVLSATGSAQSGNVVSQAADAAGVTDRIELRFTAGGSSYAYEGEGADATRVHSRVIEWTQVETPSESRIEAIRKQGIDGRETVDSWTIDSDAGWQQRLDRWLVPHVFLRDAIGHDVHTEARTEFSIDYTAVSFETSDGHRVEGLIDSEQNLRKLRLWLEGADGDEMMVETSYSYYQDFDGVRFPDLITRKRDGELDLILSVRTVDSLLTRG